MRFAFLVCVTMARSKKPLTDSQRRKYAERKQRQAEAAKEAERIKAEEEARPKKERVATREERDAYFLSHNSLRQGLVDFNLEILQDAWK